MYCFPGFIILPSFPAQLQGPIIVCAVFAYPSFVESTCGPSMPQGGSDDTYFSQINPKFLFTIYIPCLCCFHSKIKSSTSSYRWSSCPAAMRCSPLYFMNFTSTRYRERLILYSLYPISGPCSFSKFIACWITCRRNGTGSFSLMAPTNSLLNSKVSLYPAAPRGLVSFSVYMIFWGSCIPTQAIVMSVFILLAVILSFPHYCLSLWKLFVSICLVHSRTWCCKFLHTLQYSVFTSSWRSFFNSPAPSVPSLHFRNTFSVLSYMCISYYLSLISSRSFASQ